MTKEIKIIMEGHHINLMVSSLMFYIGGKVECGAVEGKGDVRKLWKYSFTVKEVEV